jgi:flagellar biosynthetic protein FlhB
VAQSVEIVSAIMLMLGLTMLFVLDDYTSRNFIKLFQEFAGKSDQIEVSPGYLPKIFTKIIYDTLLILTPYLMVTTAIALLMNHLQIGFLFTTKPLEPKLDKLSPIKGFQRIFSMKSLFELFKNLLKLVLVGATAGTIIAHMWPGIISEILMAPMVAVDFAQSVGLRIALMCTALLFILAILDYLYKKYEHEKSIKMSKQEVKDEYKNMEGDPQIKQKIKEMGRKIAMSRMFEQIEEADAVISNPTHYAVAVAYELDWPAPKVLAKGTDYIALRIIRYAEEHDVPVYQQPELARALIKVELDDFIPANLFKAVAKVLAYLARYDSRLKRKLSGVKPAGKTASQPR